MEDTYVLSSSNGFAADQHDTLICTDENCGIEREWRFEGYD
jgi:hypothetical protein